MYRNKKFNRNSRTTSTETDLKKRQLNTIDENTTIKVPRKSSNDDRRSIFDDDDGLPEPQSSEENIPASQEPSQRYLSQRSNIASTLGRTQSWNSSSRPPNTYLELTLTKAGVNLNDSDSFVLSCDHVAFVAKLRDLLKGNHNYPSNIEIFKTGLLQALEPKSKLAVKLLSGCTISSSDELTYQSQDSMIMNFLMIDFLCEHVLDVLLEKIEQAATDRGDFNKQTQIPLLPLMLAQLRYVVSSYGDLIYNRIKCIFEKANKNGKRNIIANAEFVFDATKHDAFAQMLLDNMESYEDFFNSTVISALTNLFLSIQMHGKLRCKIVAYVESNECPNNLLSLLFKFMLKILNEDKDIPIQDVVNTIRNILLHYSNKNNEMIMEKQELMDLFNVIEQGLTRSKKFYIFWQRTIATLPENQFRCIDFLILLMLIHIKDDNSQYIENILRRRIKNDNFSSEILYDAKTKFSVVLEKYTTILMFILHDFLKEKNVAVANFARSSYSEIFEICESLQRNILKQLLELTLNKSTQNMTNIALDILKTLHRQHPREIQNWGMLLMPLLDRLNEMTMSQTRIIMGLLCSIAYPSESSGECHTLQDQIDMLVKKQIINRSASVKKQGIIGSAQLIDCIARFEDTCIETQRHSMSFNTVSEIPEGRGKIAAKLFERIQTATIFPESLALFYDEMASICSTHNDDPQQRFLNKPFLLWLSETMALYFQTCFTTEDNPVALGGIPLSALKCINTLDDTNSELSDNSALSLAVRISDLVLKPSNESTSSIYVLAPTFNLLRMLYLQRSEGSLESINALLGCAIILPTFFDDEDIIDRFRSEFDNDTQMKILDIYFHCANWMRVTISSFITQRDTGTKTKVLQRLNDLIEIEGKIRKLVKLCSSDYIPPKCQFLCDNTPVAKRGARSKPSEPKSSAKSKTTNNPPESEMTLLNDTVPNNTMRINNSTRLGGIQKSNNNNKTNFGNLYGPKEIYRQMDTSIMLLLTEKLTIEIPLPAEEIGNKIGLPELHFILTDLVSKLESIMGIQKFHNEENLQYISKPHYFMNDLSKFIKSINENIVKISTAINEKLEKVNRIYSNMDLFTEEFCYLRSCLDLSMRLIAAYFSWSEFNKSTNNDLLKLSLLGLLEPTKLKEYEKKTFKELIPEVFNVFIKYESSILDLKAAVNLYDFLVVLRRFSVSHGAMTDTLNKQSQEIRSLCKVFLQRKWFSYNGQVEKGASCNICLDELIKGFLKNCDFKRQLDILNIIQGEIKHLNGKDSTLKSFPNVKKANFPILFRGLCEILIVSVNDIIITQKGLLSGDKLHTWEKSCELLNTLLAILRAIDIPRNFQIFLKYSHLYLKLVLQYALEDMENCLRQSSDRVLAFLDLLRVSTKYLHSLCCHSKAEKNTMIVSQIPFLRETMETLVFRVKALLAANKCASVFTLKDLRNEDIHGQVLLSQTTSSSAEDSEEEMPEDDATVCDSLIEPNEMASNIYAKVRESNGRVSKSSSRSNCY